MAYTKFENLEVWKMGCSIAVRVYSLLKDSKDFGLKDQMTRAAVSIASNIAEGSERGSSADFVRFLHIAKGSSAELRTQLIISNQVGLICSKDMEELVEELRILSAKLHSLIVSLKSSPLINLKHKT